MSETTEAFRVHGSYWEGQFRVFDPETRLYSYRPLSEEQERDLRTQNKHYPLHAGQPLVQTAKGFTLNG